MKAIKRIWLRNTPLDKWTGERWVQSTGFDVMLEDGSWVAEFEDNKYEDRADCIYKDEKDDETWAEYFNRKDTVFIIVDEYTGEVYKEIEVNRRHVVNWTDFKGFDIVKFDRYNNNEVTVWVKPR